MVLLCLNPSSRGPSYAKRYAKLDRAPSIAIRRNGFCRRRRSYFTEPSREGPVEEMGVDGKEKTRR